MTKMLNLSPEIETQISQVSQQTGLKEDELILEAILSYLEEFEDIKEAQERLLNPPDRYLSLEEVEKQLDLED